MVSANAAIGTQATPQRSVRARLFGLEEGLISRASVLWLSGVLIGMVLAGDLTRSIDLYFLEFGVFGFVAYVTLEVAAQRRCLRRADEELNRLLWQRDEAPCRGGSGNVPADAPTRTNQPGRS